MKKRIVILTILVAILIVLFTTNGILLSQSKTCTYTISNDLYDQSITVKITKSNHLTTTKKYSFRDQEVLELEKELLILDEYDININDLSLTATKKEHISKYVDTIQEYQEAGFQCK